MEGLSDPLGQVVPLNRTHEARRRARWGAQQGDQSLLGATWTKPIPASGSATPSSPSPDQHPHPKGTESGPLGRHLNLALPLCLFSTMGTACMLPVFSTCLHLWAPAGLPSTWILLKKSMYPGVVGFPRVGQHCQESEKGKASARLRHRRCRRMVQVPPKPVPDPSVNPFGPQFTGGIPLCAA